MNIKTGPPTEGDWIPFEELKNRLNDYPDAYLFWGKGSDYGPYLYLYHPKNKDKFVNLSTGSSYVSTPLLVKPITKYAIVVTSSE